MNRNSYQQRKLLTFRQFNLVKPNIIKQIIQKKNTSNSFDSQDIDWLSN